MGNVILRLVFLLISAIFLIQLVYADTTFFDNPDDIFIIGNSSAGRVTEITAGAISGVTDEGGCMYKWNCTDWSRCFLPGKQIRNCTNIGTCSSAYKVPGTEQKCIYTIFPKAKVENMSGILLYSAVVLIILSIIFYLKRDYFKKVIKKSNF